MCRVGGLVERWRSCLTTGSATGDAETVEPYDGEGEATKDAELEAGDDAVAASVRDVVLVLFGVLLRL